MNRGGRAREGGCGHMNRAMGVMGIGGGTCGNEAMDYGGGKCTHTHSSGVNNSVSMCQRH